MVLFMSMSLVKIYEEGHADLFPFHLFMDQWAQKLADKAGADFKSSCAVFRNGGVEWYADPAEQTKLAKEVLRRCMHEDFFETVRDNTTKLLNEMNTYIEQLEKLNFSDKTSHELAEIYNDYCNRVVELNSWGTLVTLMEMGQESVVTKEVFAYLGKKGREVNAVEKVPEAIGGLCTPIQGTYLRDKKIEAMKLALMARQKGISNIDVQNGIDELRRKYCWVSYGYVGPEIPRGVFEKEVAEFSQQSNLEKELELALNEDEEIKKKQRELGVFFKVDEYGEKLFTLARTFMFQKEYRKQVLYHSFYVFFRLRKEIAKRTNISLNNLAYALPMEVEQLLQGKLDASVFNVRKKLCVYLPPERKILINEQAGKFVASISPLSVSSDISELRGESAFVGEKVTGTVAIVLTLHDLNKLKQGDVLVSPATSPAMVPAMKIAAAIVTDQGGLTCHAAIVSRELKKPCIIGTKIATKWLMDGDEVEVDTTKGIVKKI